MSSGGHLVCRGNRRTESSARATRDFADERSELAGDVITQEMSCLLVLLQLNKYTIIFPPSTGDGGNYVTACSPSAQAFGATISG